MTADAKNANLKPGWAILSGLCASLVGIGLARFAYTPLIPALISARWFTPSQAAYLGAANFAGYLAGAMFGRRLQRVAAPRTILRAMMLLAAVTFFACTRPVSFLWFMFWRFASGISGGVLMVLTALTVLPHVPPSRRGLAGGAIFTGVSLGVVISGAIMPRLLSFGLETAWVALGALALILTAVAWFGWPKTPATAEFGLPKTPADNTSHGENRAGISALKWFYVQYGLNAFGMVPHMVFLVDFVARGLDQGLESGAWYWVLFGLGAMTGPLIAGVAADRIGFGPAIRLAILVQILAVALPIASVSPVWLTVSSLAGGAVVLGMVNLALGRIREFFPNDEKSQQRAWSLATSGFALGQAGGAYGLSFIFARSGSYIPLFAIGAGVSVFALVMEFGIPDSRAGRSRKPEHPNQTPAPKPPSTGTIT